jgi:redox-sensitive bicupin YhaK (pirin superfamily)
MPATLTPQVDVRRADERLKTRLGWLDSKHSFSFSRHYDPANTHHGLLLVNNDDIVKPGTGFETHPHRDMEIVTWVLQGSLVHQDSEGHTGVIYPGLAQRMSAGTGILHSEKNDSWRLAARGRTTPPIKTRCTSCRCGSCRTSAASIPATSSWRSTTSCSPAAW